MKKLTLFFLFIFLSAFLTAQNAPKQKEIGITFSDLSKNNYGVFYAVGTQKSMWRFSAIYISGNTQNMTTTDFDSQGNLGNKSIEKITNAGIRLDLGREFIKQLNTHVEFRYGPSVSFSFSYNHSTSDLSYPNQTAPSSTKTNRTNFSPGLGCILSLDYKISKHFLAGLEYQPGISFSMHTITYYTNNMKIKTIKNNYFNWSANNLSGGHLLVIYRF